MSRTPGWVRPTIATASLVAVGAASVVLGASFTPAPAADPVTPEVFATQAFPVLQPAGYGELWAPDDSVVENSLSYEQGTRETRVDAHGVPTPGADVEDAARVLSESPDPVIDAWDFGIVGEDDPCAPADGSDIEGCPDGLRGATFSVISPDNLWAMFRANPPVEITNPYEIAHCPAAEVGANALRYSVVTNAPGAIELRYWPRGDERTVTTITVSSSPQQTTDWESGLATADNFEGDWSTLQHCATLDGLEKYVSYYYELHIEDVLGREFSSSLTRPFSLPDDRTAPEFRVTPLGQNAILASAPHRENTDVRFNVQVLDPGDTDDCSATDDHLPLVNQAVGATTVDVSAEYLAERGYQSQYTKRTSIAVYVPARATVLVCAGVYEPDRPGWQWLEAQYRYTMVLQTPDTPRPVITVGAVDLSPGYERADVSLSARWSDTGEHLACTLWSGGSAASPCGGNPHDVTRGDVWVTSNAALGGERTRFSSLLPLGSIDCYDGCVTPDTAWYTVPIKVQERPGETCGSGVIGPCPETVIGTAILRVDWMPGARGDDTWVFSPPTAGVVEHELAPLPQMDWLVTPEVVAGSSPRDSMVRFTLETDRPVDYTARLLGDCERPSAVFEQSGSITTVGKSVVFTGACAGEQYTLQVQLTDADGATNLFGGPGGLPWPDSRIVTPGLGYDVVMGQHLALKQSVDQMKVREFRVRVDGQAIAPRLPENSCVYRHDLNTPPSATLESARLGELVTVEVVVQLAEAFGSTDGTRAFCNAGVESGTPVYRMSVEVPLDDLITGVTIAAPEEAPYVAEVTLQAILPR